MVPSSFVDKLKLTIVESATSSIYLRREGICHGCDGQTYFCMISYAFGLEECKPVKKSKLKLNVKALDSIDYR